MIDWSEYMSLKQMAFETGRSYKTLHAYVLKGKIPALKRNGTRWFVHEDIVEQFEQGDLDVSGTFRKSN